MLISGGHLANAKLNHASKRSAVRKGKRVLFIFEHPLGCFSKILLPNPYHLEDCGWTHHCQESFPLVRNAPCHKKGECFVQNVICRHQSAPGFMRQSNHSLMIRVALVDPSKKAACIQKNNAISHKSTHPFGRYSSAQYFPAHRQIAAQGPTPPVVREK